MGSWKMARFFGIDVKVHFTFALALLLGAVSYGQQYDVHGYAFGVVVTLLMFACVLIHELSHSVVAQAFGIPVRQITIYPIGGVAQITKRPSTPVQELLIAIAGPASNVVIAGGLFLAGTVLFGFHRPDHSAQQLLSRPTTESLWWTLVVVNIGLAVFNMIPALPMDGGRVLRAALSMGAGTQKGTTWAAQLGRLLALLMIGVGVFIPAWGLMLVGVFVYFGASAELAEARRLQLLEGVRVIDALNPHVVRLSPDTPVQLVAPTLAFSPQNAFEVRLGERLLGVATRAELIAAMRTGQPAFVAGVMRREYPTVSPNASLEEARDRMNSALSPFVAVVQNGECIGLITEHELAAQAMMKEMAGEYQSRAEKRWDP
ncbi:MAG: site-2 protease family protein [Myxococcaceae bacterium]